jgi:hypothetical protein
MTGRAKSNQIDQIVGSPVISFKQPERDYVMDGQGLSELVFAILASDTTMLAGVLVSLECFSSLGIPVRPMPIYAVSMNKLRMIFPDSVNALTFTGTIFSYTSSAFHFPFALAERVLAVQTDTFHPVFTRSSTNRGILAFWRTMFSSSMLYPARCYLKLTFAKLTCSFDLLSHFLKTKTLRKPSGGVVVKATSVKASEGFFCDYSSNPNKTKTALTDCVTLTTGIIAQTT